MTSQASGAKGLKTEELVRAYFLRAGFFVMRGVKLRHSGSDLTDIDLWIYERSTTFARRRTIVDIKDKKVPQAAERLFFAKGLSNILGVDGAGVATTDNRSFLREMARKNGVLWIDGADLQRLKNNDILSGLKRLTEEEINEEISKTDNLRRGRSLREKFDEVRSSVIDRFGPSCANIALEAFQAFAKETVTAHPNSETARILGRLSLVSAAIAAAALDFALADVALRPTPERARFVADLIRFGHDAENTMQHIRWAEMFIRDYIPNGQGLAQTAKDQLMNDFRGIPAESLSEIVVKLGNSDKLFHVARDLESAAYGIEFSAFDQLGVDVKVFIGSMLDFSKVDRRKFAESWTAQGLIPDRVGGSLAENTDATASERRSVRSVDELTSDQKNLL